MLSALRRKIRHRTTLPRSAAERRALRDAFDAAHYLAVNGDVREAGLDPLIHYMSAGWREGRNPAPGFDAAWYAETHDIGDQNPLLHWLRQGRDKGLATAPEGAGLGAGKIAESDLDALRAAFDADFYLARNPDVREAGLNPFLHWVMHGRDEGRPGQPRRDSVRPAIPDPAEIDWSACPQDDTDAIADRFDRGFYLSRYPEVAGLGVDPEVHYLMLGWKLGYDPRPDFSTRYYIDRYVDIQRAGVNPFLHYCRNGHLEQRETVSYIKARRDSYHPLVSVILPNYNHAKYLPQRIRSIAEQTYDNLEIIILDDKSSDESQEVIRRTVEDLGIKARLEFNTVNSGNVFAQWRKGLSLATGDLVWICESDDFCEPDFVEKLVPTFADESVNIAFGRIQFANAEGAFMEGLDRYREGAEPGIWDDTLTRPAAEWFDGAWGVNNIYANVGGGMFRRMALPEEVWTEARSFRICGDWFLYLHIAGAGQITYEPRAVAYFRQHGMNTSASNFHQRYYYDENMRILRLLAESWGISTRTRLRFLDKVKAQYRHFGLAETMGDFDETFGVAELLAMPRRTSHVQFYFLGFHPGGGELFPINLANAFLEAGHMVSMVAVDLSCINADMRARLDRRIPAYHASHLTARGRAGFLEASGVSVINSHVASADAFLYTLSEDPIERPWVVTLHGSYVAFEEDVPQTLIDWILENVSGWIYTADRNLEFFENREVDWDGFVKLPNAMPRDNRPAPFSREELGIAEGDTVFTLVARGIKRKGWRAAVEAFRALRETHGRRNAHLLLIGEGELTDTARRLAEDLPGVHFLGYQSEINGILRLSNCLILPSRFEGESYPLCLIQAIQEHVPAIATDIGEVRAMMSDEDGRPAGILLKNQRDSRAFFAALTAAMVEMCDPALRSRFAALAQKRAEFYDMQALVGVYEEVYETAGREFGRSG